ncbi:MAG: hypothetical protein L6V88_12050 [Anaerotruncus sp.]|nr:MAG: hypothetical protein L6V88_12050 [Anaerotruncus sp.]
MWPKLHDMFDKCLAWQDYVGGGSWPDCDMLPLGRLTKKMRLITALKTDILSSPSPSSSP